MASPFILEVQIQANVAGLQEAIEFLPTVRAEEENNLINEINLRIGDILTLVHKRDEEAGNESAGTEDQE